MNFFRHLSDFQVFLFVLFGMEVDDSRAIHIQMSESISRCGMDLGLFSAHMRNVANCLSQNWADDDWSAVRAQGNDGIRLVSHVPVRSVNECLIVGISNRSSWSRSKRARSRTARSPEIWEKVRDLSKDIRLFWFFILTFRTACRSRIACPIKLSIVITTLKVLIKLFLS